MNRIANLMCVVCLSVIPNAGWCYGIDTHKELSEAAAKGSVLGQSDMLGKSDVLGRMGIIGTIGISPTDIAKTFPDHKGTPRTILDLIRNGAKFEDQPAINVRNHFYNPLNGQALSAPILGEIGCTSPDWALEDNGQINSGKCGEQKFSFADARWYLFSALTQFAEPDRDKNFGLAFESLGHVVHHLQDMAQPQHVRSDQHLELSSELEIGLCTFVFDLRYCLAYLAIRNPSAYEGYTDRPPVRSSPQFMSWLSNATPVYGEGITPKFFKPRDFWAGDNGIATFTNRNMLSAGTNFDNPGVNVFPLYDPAGDSYVDIQTLRPGTTLHGFVTFYATKAANPALGDIPNPLASSRSIYDWDLTKFEGNPRNTKRAQTLNRINYDKAHALLIPRAVNYSAGLINYFFRGEIDFVPDPVNAGKYIIKNLGAEDLTGSFTLYYDAVDGNRNPVLLDSVTETWTNRTIAAKGQLDNLSFTPPTSPVPKTPGEYMLVFKGDMGEEKAIPGTTVGAVVAKVVQAKIAFTSSCSAATSSINVMNADGSGQTRLTNNAAGDYYPAWSPDGARIAFVSTRDGNRQIYVMNADGSNQTRLTFVSSVDDDPSWSPDGTQFALAYTVTDSEKKDRKSVV